MEFYTIGVYNSTETMFFTKLIENRIDTFCDIRQRRAVRGAKYSFVNSVKLQQRLAELDIKYGHVLKLAPTSDIRDLQKKVDLQKRVLKSERQSLGEVFIQEYTHRILENFDFEYFLENLENVGASRIGLFCVEERAEACHRSLVASILQERFAYKVSHI